MLYKNVKIYIKYQNIVLTTTKVNTRLYEILKIILIVTYYVQNI